LDITHGAYGEKKVIWHMLKSVEQKKGLFNEDCGDDGDV
jgi:hypothetical protein